MRPLANRGEHGSKHRADDAKETAFHRQASATSQQSTATDSGHEVGEGEAVDLAVGDDHQRLQADHEVGLLDCQVARIQLRSKR